MSDEASIRRRFPGVEQLRYFNAAAQGLLPTPALEAVREMAELQSRRGILGWEAFTETIEATRGRLATLIGARPDQIAFTASTVDGLSRIAGGFDLEPGDEIVLCDLEYPSNVYPWAARGRDGARLRWVRAVEGRAPVERYLEAIGPRTRVVAVSHVQFNSGYRLELAALGEACREAGALLVVDAIQSTGVVPVDVVEQGIGALALEGRKWLLGPPGCGALFIADDWVERIRPTVVGSGSVREPDELMQYVERIGDDGALEPRFRQGARRHEAGFPNLTGIAGLGASLALAESIGRATVRDRIAARVGELVGALPAAGYRIYGPREPDERAGIVTFEPDSPAADYDPMALFERLNAQGISISVRDGRLRAAPHVYNDRADVEALLEALP